MSRWFVALSLFAAACGAPAVDEESSPIVQATNTSQAPWVVWITGLPNGAQSASCTGSVLTQHWLLTAGHCVDGASTGTISVTMQSSAGAVSPAYSGGATLYPNPTSASIEPSPSSAGAKAASPAAPSTASTGSAASSASAAASSSTAGSAATTG